MPDRPLVLDAMHARVIACAPGTPLRTVARMLATYRVHAILVHSHGDQVPDDGTWGVVSDVDVLRATAAGDVDGLTAGDLARTPVWAVTATEELASAVELMAEHDVTHVVVVEPRSARPVGVLSTLDVARAVAGFPERHPVTPSVAA